MTEPLDLVYHQRFVSESAMGNITVIGAGVAGLWQAFRLARDGHSVRLIERSSAPFETAASRLAGAMLAPFCEGEAAEPWITALGREAVPLWREAFPETAANGSLVVALPRDIGELSRFSRMTHHHQTVGADEIAALEPALAGRFRQGLFYPEEGHLQPLRALAALLKRLDEMGVETRFGVTADPDAILRDGRRLRHRLSRHGRAVRSADTTRRSRRDGGH